MKMAKTRFIFEVQLRYRNYCGEEIVTATLAKFQSENVAQFFATSYTKDMNERDDKNMFYCSVVRSEK